MNEFIVNLMLSFAVGGIWITLLSIFSERFGSKVGGAIAGIPATMVISLLFIAITQGSEEAVNSTTIIPLMLGINILFVLIFILLLRFGIITSLLLSLTFWFTASLALKTMNFDSFIFSVLGYALLMASGYYILEHVLKIKSFGGKKIRYTKLQIMARGVISGATVLVSVLSAKLSGPLLGGVFASFPALTIALIFLFYQSGSENFIASFLKNFVITGTINVFIFALGVRYTYASLGVMYGTALSIALSIITAYLLYHLVNKRMG